MVSGRPRERAARASVSMRGAELGGEALVLAGLEARMQGRQLDRQPRAAVQRVGVHGRERPRRLADGVDRGEVALEVNIGVLLRARRLAEHVVGEQVALRLVLLGTLQRLANGAPEHELVAQHLHRLADGLADDRLAGAGDEALQGVEGIGAARLAQLDDAPGEHQRPGRGVDQQAVGVSAMLVPMAFGELFGDQLVGRLAVGDPQQRLGDAHEDDAFLAGKAVLAHEGVDAGVLAAVGARGIDETARKVGRAAALVLAEHGALDQPVEQALLVDEMMRGDFIARRQLRKFDDLARGLRVLHCDHSALVMRTRGAIRFTFTLANRGRGCFKQPGDDARA